MCYVSMGSICYANVLYKSYENILANIFGRMCYGLHLKKLGRNFGPSHAMGGLFFATAEYFASGGCNIGSADRLAAQAVPHGDALRMSG